MQTGLLPPQALPSTGHVFDFENTAEWEKHLREQGYVVIRGTATPEDVETARGGYWGCIEAATKGTVKRADPATWTQWHTDHRGIMLDGDLAHSKGAWTIRGLPRVQQAFGTIWKENDLISSFDSTLIWKPWTHNARWRPRCEGLHMDQNPFEKEGMCCVQGMMPLYDVTEATGGLAVVPASHLDTSIHDRHQHWGTYGDFCVLERSDPAQRHRHLVVAQAGDLILWDSRTVHGGHTGTGVGLPADVLARLTQTVCMVPRKWASPEVLQWRQSAFERGDGTTHWPQEMNRSCQARGGYRPIDLTESQRAVL
eukprot:TRINITY_DN14036_c0_g1_i1.p1 TRINITY_DN14036_c0_g1~~TRINITY_DN14036_c0_g1_i1.p1  ORF type:complete len:332 (+),score=20.89 TRINITY_DN14036_c0_g1_i1:66-998(+)